MNIPLVTHSSPGLLQVPLAITSRKLLVKTAMPHATFTIGMPPEMLVDVDEEARKHNMSRSEYVRHLVRQAQDSPFEVPDTVLCADENGSADEAKTGAA